MHRPRLRDSLVELVHLATRFFGSLSPRPLDPDDDAWITANLTPSEGELWTRMSRPDRKHAAGVARDVDRRLGGADRPVIAAAALHDVGKVAAGYGTLRRALVTAAAAVVGRDRLVARGGATARYLTHDIIGAEMLAAAGSDPLTVAWAREHHLDAVHRSVPPRIGDALAAADDD